ncbi:Cytochrome P450 4c3 [Araneus ventricosus]|uniref:Cytochrome P450 4c3 n=1 Tax=Araneus ventricosus TaxID=182803 RepID=A0A4Y2MS51_ARAVE|nr:Cytochrome P450 4c3 [Araneus ventricosus]
MWILYEPFVLFSKADAVKELLKGKAINEKCWLYDFTKFLFGTGLLTSGGTKWKSRRKLLNPCFHTDILKDFQEVFDKHAQKLANFFQCETENELTYIETQLRLSNLDIVCETIFGVPVAAFQNKNPQYIKAISRLSEIVMVRVYNFFLWPEFIFKHTHYYKEQVHYLKVLQDFSRSVIREKKDRYLRGGNNSDKRKRKALMDMLLERHFEFQDLSEEDIREEVDLFIIAVVHRQFL